MKKSGFYSRRSAIRIVYFHSMDQISILILFDNETVDQVGKLSLSVPLRVHVCMCSYSYSSDNSNENKDVHLCVWMYAITFI